MAKKLFIVVVLILGILLFYKGKSYISKQSRGPKEGRVLTPTVAGLDFDTVYFDVDTQPEFTKELYSYGLEKLEKAGLIRQENRDKKRVSTLILTLNPIPLGEKAPGKVMYLKKLELIENVSIMRNPKITTPASTWKYESVVPQIADADAVTIKQLEADADRFLFEFIRAYKIGNPT